MEKTQEASKTNLKKENMKSKDNDGEDSGITNSAFEELEIENLMTEQRLKFEKRVVKESDDIALWYPRKESDVVHEANEENEEKKEKLLQYIEANVIGKDAEFFTPYGRRKCKILI